MNGNEETKPGRYHQRDIRRGDGTRFVARRGPASLRVLQFLDWTYAAIGPPESHCISKATVRSQLLSVFGKLGVRRQTELVKLIYAFYQGEPSIRR